MILFLGLLKGHHQTELPDLSLDFIILFINAPGTLWSLILGQKSGTPICKAFYFITLSEKHKTKYPKGVRLCPRRLYVPWLPSGTGFCTLSGKCLAHFTAVLYVGSVFLREDKSTTCRNSLLAHRGTHSEAELSNKPSLHSDNCHLVAS